MSIPRVLTAGNAKMFSRRQHTRASCDPAYPIASDLYIPKLHFDPPPLYHSSRCTARKSRSAKTRWRR